MLTVDDTERQIDAALHSLGRLRGPDVFVVSIGAMDGVTYDSLRPYVDRYGWSGLFVEPVPDQFDALVRSFAGASPSRRLQFERAAIADRDGDVEMVRVPASLVQTGQVGAWLIGMSTLWPPRNGFTRGHERIAFEQHAQRFRVPSMTVPSLLTRHGIDRIDVLQIDVEGYDWTVLRQFDLARYRPAVVRVERGSVPLDEQRAMHEHLQAHGYAVIASGEDLVGIRDAASRVDATFVTAVYERRADDAVGGRGLPLAWYLTSLRSIVRTGAPLVVYTQDRLVGPLEEFFAAEGAPALVISRPLSTVPRFWAIQETRLRHRVHAFPHRDRCHVLCFAKFAWLAEQARRNVFGTRHCYWIDAGLASEALFPSSHLPRQSGAVCDLFSPALPAALVAESRFVVFALTPMIGRNLHSVDVDDMQRVAGAAALPIATHVVGGLFGGRRDEVIEFAGEFDRTLGELLAGDLLGTEENVLTILFHRQRDRFTARTLSTWYHEDTGFTQPAPSDVPFYRAVAGLTDIVHSR
jgi:FkbM family methyltransferase